MQTSFPKFNEVLDDDYKYFEVGITDLDLERHFNIERVEDTDEDRRNSFERKRRLLRKVYKLATRCLTDRQLQIFLMRYKLEMRVHDISKALSVSEAYCSSVCKIVVSKLKKELAKRSAF